MVHTQKSQTNGKSTLKGVIWYIVLYIHLSKDDGDDESPSVTSQKKILTGYVEKFLQGEYVIVGYYVDDRQTGMDHDRSDFQRMIHDVESGKVNRATCESLARAFRNYADQGCSLKNYFPLHGTCFITLGEPKVDIYLNPEAVSGMGIPINGLVNDRFAYSISNGIRRIFDTRCRNDEFIGAFTPYGYEKHPTDKNALIIDEEAAWVVWDIFQWFVYGDGSTGVVADENGVEQEVLKDSMSKEGIARKFSEMGVPNPTLYKVKKGCKYKSPHAKESDGLWTRTSVSRFLKNKVCIGIMVQREQRVISYKVHGMVNVPKGEWYQVNNTHEAITPLELFEKSQEPHAKDTRTAPGKTETHLFSGFLKYANCGKSIAHRASDGFVCYNYSTYKKESKDKCAERIMRFDISGRAVLLIIQKHIEFVESLEEVLNDINQVPVAQTKSTQLKHLLKFREQELEKTEDLISGPYMDWKNGDITHGRYRRMEEKLEQQEEQLKEVIEHIRDEIDITESGITFDDPYL